MTLAPEGGAHQSTIRLSVVLELPGILACEPSYAGALDWLLCDGLARLADADGDGDGESLYCRLSSRPIDQAPFDAAADRYGADALRTAVLAGGYRLREPGQGEPLVIAASGPVLSEVLDAAAGLEDEGVAATVIDVTSLDRLFRGWKGTLADAARHAEPATSAGHLEMLLRPSERTAPIVTVHDAASHSMAWLGSVFGQRVVPVGVDSFGESGTIEELYDVFGLLPAQMVNAALVGLSRRRSAPAAVRSR